MQGVLHMHNSIPSAPFTSEHGRLLESSHCRCRTNAQQGCGEMIVYSDPQFTIEPGVLIAQVQARLHTLMDAAAPDVDDLRTLLIACGQLEQGIHDALAACLSTDDADSRIEPYSALTNHAADAFYHAWAASTHEAVGQALQDAMQTLDQLTPLECEQVTVKLPE